MFKPKTKQFFMRALITIAAISAAACLLFSQCTDGNKNEVGAVKSDTTSDFGAFDSQVKWGENLVKNAGCNDCHTPKKMGPTGPENDMSLMLSGHPSQQPPSDFDAKEAAKKGLIVTQTFTSWTGPWGVTYAVNLTSDSTGIGAWTEAQFIKALKQKRWMGLDATRPLMPPMSMMPATEMSDDELKAIFAYLKTTPPVKNIVPEAVLLPPPPAK